MAERDLSKEPVLMMGSIQSDLLLGHSKKAEALVFFKIVHEQPFKHFIRQLPITSAAAVYRPQAEPVALATGEEPPATRYGVAFTPQGLAALHVHALDQLPKADAFGEGMAKRAVQLFNDADPNSWVVGNPKQELHGVFIITGTEALDVERGLHLHFTDLIHGFKIVEVLRGEVRKAQPGHEHFGFLDGVSQPGIRGCVDPAQEKALTPSVGDAVDQGIAGQDLLWPGEFVFGYPAQNGAAASFTDKGTPSVPPLPFMVNGAYLVIRRLQQFVPEMKAGTAAEAKRVGLDADKLASQLVGRWPSGAPISKTPDADNPGLGGDELANNDFEFGDDREGVTCPWAAHIRKAYPRDDVPGQVKLDEDDPKDKAIIDAAEARTQSHRMLRRGIQFGPELTDAEKRAQRTIEQRGLLFKCYVTSIEDQFEFVQQSWVDNPHFVQEGSGIDAIIGQAPGAAARPFTGAGKPGKKPQLSFAPWVKMTGGEYFFAPSIDFLRNLR